MTLPVLTPAEVKAVDERALQSESLDAILSRVGTALGREIIAILGGTYGRRINVLIGPGLNGADAEVAAVFLERQGVRVRRFGHEDLPSVLPAADLTIDGLFGIGLSRPFVAPDPGIAPVVSIDIASGIDGLTGEALGSPFQADITLTLMSHKRGLMFGAGPAHSGEVRVVDIGLSPGESLVDLVTDDDVAAWRALERLDVHN